MDGQQPSTRDLIGRVYLALSVALVGGAAVGGLIGFIGANQCTAEGFACLGWIVYGILGCVLLALILAVVALRRMRVSWPILAAIVVGILGFVMLAMTFTEASGVLILTGVLWPAVVIAARAASRRGRTVGLGSFAAVVVVACLATTWMGESRSIEFGAQSYARSKVTVWGPANDGALEGGSVIAIVSPTDQSLNYAYDADGQSVDVVIRRAPGGTPADGQVVSTDESPRATSVRRGDDVIEIRVVRSGTTQRLLEVEKSLAGSFVRRTPQWLAGLDEPLHRMLAR